MIHGDLQQCRHACCEPRGGACFDGLVVVELGRSLIRSRGVQSTEFGSFKWSLFERRCPCIRSGLTPARASFSAKLSPIMSPPDAVWFSFRSCFRFRFACCFLRCLPRVLQPGQHYKVGLELDMPTTSANIDVGVFMVRSSAPTSFLLVRVTVGVLSVLSQFSTLDGVVLGTN